MNIDTLIEYLKIHLISLEQDLEQSLMGEGYEFLQGQIKATEHILGVINE
jgi:hypothetical protein